MRIHQQRLEGAACELRRRASLKGRRYSRPNAIVKVFTFLCACATFIIPSIVLFIDLIETEETLHQISIYYLPDIFLDLQGELCCLIALNNSLVSNDRSKFYTPDTLNEYLRLQKYYTVGSPTYVQCTCT